MASKIDQIIAERNRLAAELKTNHLHRVRIQHRLDHLTHQLAALTGLPVLGDLPSIGGDPLGLGFGRRRHGRIMKLNPLSSTSRSPAPTPRSDSSFEHRRAQVDLRTREAAVAAERGRALADERRAFEAERRAFEQQRVERDDASAFDIARDLGGDVAADRLARDPKGLAGRIVAAGRMRRGELTAECRPMPARGRSSSPASVLAAKSHAGRSAVPRRPLRQARKRSHQAQPAGDPQ